MLYIGARSIKHIHDKKKQKQKNAKENRLKGANPVVKLWRDWGVYLSVGSGIDVYECSMANFNLGSKAGRGGV